jgi:hypothetical protein
MLNIETYLHGLEGAVPLTCSLEDPHCEGPTEAINPEVGTGEPMTVLAISLYNFRHPRGYRPTPEIVGIAQLPTRVVQHRHLGQNVTTNGNEARFGDTYNFVVSDAYAIGSASQDYITNTHHAYWPNPQQKLVNVVLGDGGTSNVPRPTAQIRCVVRLDAPTYTQRERVHTHTRSLTHTHTHTHTHGHTDTNTQSRSVQPDWMDSPYGIWKHYPGGLDRLGRASHLTLHPGMVQWENVLLATVALNGNDALDGFTTDGAAGNLCVTSLARLPRNKEHRLRVRLNDARRVFQCQRTTSVSDELAVLFALLIRKHMLTRHSTTSDLAPHPHACPHACTHARTHNNTGTRAWQPTFCFLSTPTSLRWASPTAPPSR